MATQQTPPLKIDRYVVIHVATTCDEHGVYVTKDSAEVIELGWILVDANTLDEVSGESAAPAVPLLSFHLNTENFSLTSFAVASSRECPRQTDQHPDHSSVQ